MWTKVYIWTSLVAQMVKHVYNAGDLGSIPGSGRFPGEGNGNPLQYSCLENPMGRGAWCPWSHKELDTTERLHFHFKVYISNHLSLLSNQDSLFCHKRKLQCE